MARFRLAPAVIGVGVTAAAVSPSAEARAEGSLTAHMVQHVVLVVVAAPLLAASRRPVAGSRPAAPWLLLTAVVLHALVMATWHLPPAFDSAERIDALHAVEHASLLATAAVFWWAVGLGSRPPHRLSILAVFAASMAGVALGAAMTLAATPWYGRHPTISDQQVAGVVMWAFAGLVYLAVGIGLFVRSMDDGEPEPRLAPPVAASTGAS